MIPLKNLLSTSYTFPMFVWHGGKMEASKPVIFVTRHEYVAKTYADERGGKLHKFILDLKNPAKNEIVDKLARQLGIEGSADDYSRERQESPSHEYLSPEMVGHDAVNKMVDALRKLGYDGAWLDGDFSMASDFSEFDSFVVWDKSTLKPV